MARERWRASRPWWAPAARTPLSPGRGSSPDAATRATDPAWAGFLDRSGAAAAAAGLGHRPLADTVVEALAWEREPGLGRPRVRAGLDRSDELAIIASLTH